MHKYHSSASNSPTSATPKRRPPLALLKRGGSVLPSPEVNSATSSRESAFSFHQNPRNSLLFGKNNVFAFDGETEKPGYLSLLQDINRLLLILKWTPNSLLHHEPQTLDGQHKSSSCSTPISVRMETITHLHLHQNDDFKSSIICVVLIDSDGVQQFSFKFMLRGHCLTFLKALETGLSPLFRIEPTLDSIKFSDTLLTENYEKTLQQNMSAELTNSTENCSKRRNSSMSSKSGGLVFRIVSFASPSQQQQKAADALVRTRNASHGHTCTVSSRSSTQTQDSKGDDQTADTTLRDSLVMATRAMQNQIQSRAFYGWLSYCRHMKTIRTQLATIVLASNDFPMEPDDANLPVNECFWRICRSEKTIPTYKQFLTRVYFHGIEPDIRAQAWPYLLRVVEWHEDFETDDRLANMKERYRADTEEWLKIELAMKEKEKDGQAISRQNSDCFEFAPKDYPPAYSSSVSSDVFDDCDFPSLKELNEEVMDEKEMLAKEFGINLTRVQKDVDRCDRTTKFYSKTENLELLRRVMCTHVYRCLKVDLNDGYVQGMCDLLAPLLVIFGDEALTLACFERLMLRMGKNFPQNTQATSGMEESLNYFRYLVEVMDPELYAQLMRNVDYSFVVFYRWLLLDFKRELLYAEVFQLWEVIWAAEVMCSRHFTLFFGLALLTQYREILIENEMDFTDVIKFFNEMAEKHNVLELLDIARKKISAFQKVIQELNNTNKD